MLSYNNHTYNTSAKLLKVYSSRADLASVKLGSRQVPLILGEGYPTVRESI